MQEDKFSSISKLSQEIDDQRETLRDPQTHEYKVINYPFGSRRVAIASDKTKKLQAARGQSLGSDIANYDDFLRRYRQDSEVFHDFDKFRAEEIMNLRNKGLISLDRSKKFYEYGFRSTSVLSYWRDHFSDVSGCDVVETSVMASKDLGYQTEQVDLNESIPDLKNVGLISSYHVFEHLSDPLVCIKKTHEASEVNTVLHVEVPIEPDGPRIRYAHLFPFHKKDLYHMLEMSGWHIVNYTDIPYTGGPAIERATAVKV